VCWSRSLLSDGKGETTVWKRGEAKWGERREYAEGRERGTKGRKWKSSEWDRRKTVMAWKGKQWNGAKVRGGAFKRKEREENIK